MRKVVKALRANERRKTRFHTERDELLPLAAWPAFFRSAMQRLTHQQAEVPWMTPSAIGFLDRKIESSWAVFEFGSGASTEWYAKRARTIISVEDDPEWFDTVVDRMSSEGISNCVIELVDTAEAFPGYIQTYADDAFDLVIVDGREPWPGHRVECLAMARSKVKPGGLIVLDDSDRVEYRVADEILADWSKRRFVGVKPFPLMAVETSAYRRPFT